MNKETVHNWKTCFKYRFSSRYTHRN